MQNSRSIPLWSDAGAIAGLLEAPAYGCFADVDDHAPVRGPRPKNSPARRSTIGNRVLLLGRIRELALYRAEVLRTHGYRVITPHTKEEALRAIRSGAFDVVVLTYTLPNELVEEFAQLVREYRADCPMVAISDSRRVDRKIDPDETVIADEGPAALIGALKRVSRNQ
jgi:CheY-like chemotaxis protein